MGKISLVGYTNVGKSTLRNLIVKNYCKESSNKTEDVFAKNMLFATLDTTVRVVELPDKKEVAVVDTVGFIRKLPHDLVEAFKSTLEEVIYSDMLIHVVDASSPKREEHMAVVYKTLEDLGCKDTPVITIFNKMDRDIALPLPIDELARDTCEISAVSGMGMDSMLQKVEELLKTFRTSLKALIPYTEGSLVSWVHGRCEILTEEHTPEGVLLEVYVDEESAMRLGKYRKE